MTGIRRKERWPAGGGPGGRGRPRPGGRHPQASCPGRGTCAQGLGRTGPGCGQGVPARQVSEPASRTGRVGLGPGKSPGDPRMPRAEGPAPRATWPVVLTTRNGGPGALRLPWSLSSQELTGQGWAAPRQQLRPDSLGAAYRPPPSLRAPSPGGGGADSGLAASLPRATSSLGLGTGSPSPGTELRGSSKPLESRWVTAARPRPVPGQGGRRAGASHGGPARASPRPSVVQRGKGWAGGSLPARPVLPRGAVLLPGALAPLCLRPERRGLGSAPGSPGAAWPSPLVPRRLG